MRRAVTALLGGADFVGCGAAALPVSETINKSVIVPAGHFVPATGDT